MPGASDAASPDPEYRPEDELKDLAKIVTAMRKLRQSGRRWLRDFLVEEFPDDPIDSVGDDDK